MRLALTWTSVWTTAVLCGCASRGNVEMLETRLRVQEDQIYALQRQLKTTGGELAASRRESDALRTRIAEHATSLPVEEESNAFHRLEAIQINKLLTGGLDRDGQPGHDHFATVITPVDANGELVKASGSLRIELLDLTGDGTERQVALWEFSEEEAENLWKKGFVGSGYSIQLPWQQTPRVERLMLHARMTTADGRQFDATHEFTVSLGAEAKLVKRDRRRPARTVARPAAKASLLDAPGRVVAPKLGKSAADEPTDSEPTGVERPDVDPPPKARGAPPPTRQAAPKLGAPEENQRSQRNSEDFEDAPDLDPVKPVRAANVPTQAKPRVRLADLEESNWQPEEAASDVDEPAPRGTDSVPKRKSSLVPPPRDLDDDFWDSLPAETETDEAESEEDAVEPPFEEDRPRPIRTSDRWRSFDAPVVR